ncbi:MAG TPA: prephenate dehydrogenase [Mycobacteriales bacterium]|nr:prephenate dehydrogenase [Mycobacteriales bacterium]
MTAPRALIVGAGLIGTSIALALCQDGWDVQVSDHDPAAVALAADLGAGHPWDESSGTVDHVVLAVPPSAVAASLLEAQRREVGRTFSDTSSVKAKVLAEAEASGCDLTTWMPAHPVAGRERGGAARAQADLFRDRPWALCPTEATSSEARRWSERVALACGAQVVELDALRHDRVMATVSHLPQLLASALAAVTTRLEERDLALAGTGLRDMTRLAAAEPALWADIVAGNAAEVGAALELLHAELGRVAPTGTAEGTEVAGLVARGNAGRARLPDKARAARDLSWVSVVVPDRPGELARLLLAVGDAGVNVEDLRLEHSPQHAWGLVELAVEPGSEEALCAAADRGGWRAHPAV